MTKLRHAWPLALGIVLVALVVWPFSLGGEFLYKDMSIPNHFAFSPDNFGAGSLPARNVPQDGALALFSMILPAPWLVRALIIFSAATAALAGWALAPSSPAPAMVIAVANPFVVERLLQGQWSLAIAAWMLPGIAAAGLAQKPTRMWLAMFVASLSPTGGVFALITGVCVARKHRLITALYGIFLCLPWIIPGLLSTPQPTNPAAAVAAFAPRAEYAVGTLGALLSLGGIWNSQALPESRTVGFALFGLVVILCTVIGFRRLFTAHYLPLWVLGCAGFGLCILTWLFPEHLAHAIAVQPGFGLFRDSQKLVMLAIPLCVVALGSVEGSWRLVAVIALFLQMPDFSSSLAVLAPSTKAGGETTSSSSALIDERLAGQIGNKTAFFPHRSGLTPAGDVDPWTKAVPMLQSGQLLVDGQVIDYPTPTFLSAQKAWETKDLAALEQLGVGVVVTDGEIVTRTNAPAAPVPWFLTTAWALSPLLLVGATALRRARR